MAPTMVAEGLVKRFGPVAAVDGVSLTVAAGEVVGLLGPNGAGKTTTLRMLAGILTPDAGGVSVSGLDLHDRPLDAKKRLGFLSGDTQLYQRLTPREVLRYFGRLYGMPDALDRRAHVAARRGARDGRVRRRGPAARCRAARSSAPTSRGRSCTSPTCSSSTSRPSRWT